MKTLSLLPHRLKLPGWILFSVGFTALVIGIIDDKIFDGLNVPVFAIMDIEIFAKDSYFSIIQNGIADELIFLFIIVGGIFVAFSKQKNEDEFISKIRLDSLVWATYVNYAVLIFGILFFYGISFLYVLLANIFTLIFFFIIRFNWKLYQSTKLPKDDK